MRGYDRYIEEVYTKRMTPPVTDGMESSWMGRGFVLLIRIRDVSKGCIKSKLVYSQIGTNSFVFSTR